MWSWFQRRGRARGLAEQLADPVVSLPHFPAAIGLRAKGVRLCSYALSLEAFRRGLQVTFYSPGSALPFNLPSANGRTRLGELFAVGDAQRSVLFRRTRTHRLDANSLLVCNDKSLAKQLWRKGGIPTPDFEILKTQPETRDVKEIVERLGSRLVVKPLRGSQGYNVHTGLEGTDAVIRAMQAIRANGQSGPLLLETQAKGDEFRIYVVGDRAVAGYRRSPARVVGDGLSSIGELIARKNKLRKRNPDFFSRPIRVGSTTIERLARDGLTLDSIPARGNVVRLSDSLNLSQGGESVEGLADIPDVAISTAIRAIQAIPGLDHAGIDLLVDGVGAGCTVEVLEVNAMAQIGGHMFPASGTASDVPSAILDFHFLGTQRQHEQWFCMKQVCRSLKNSSTGTLKMDPDSFGREGEGQVPVPADATGA